MHRVHARILAVAAAASIPVPAQSDVAAVPDGAPAAMASIDRDGLEEHATFLASDELGGRYTTSSGQEQAAEYIANYFESLGLKPLGDGRGRRRSYYQSWPVERLAIDLKKSALTIGEQEYRTGFAVVPGEKPKVRVTGGFVYCGHGEPDKIPKGVRRRVPVMMLRVRGAGQPRRGGVFVQQLNKVGQICRELERRGARMAVFCVLADDGGFADEMNRSILLPDKPVLRYRSGDRRLQALPIPAVFVNAEISKQLLRELGVDLQGNQSDPKRRAPGRLQLEIEHDEKATAKNVVAVLGGKGGLAKDAVVFSAHMDHMGTRLDGDPFNGADDNASGTAGLLEIAQAFAAGEPPQRSLIFLAVSGEELGLWGSDYYASHPTWPKQRIVADINIDMIGRIGDLSGESAVSVTPSYRHDKYSSMGRDAAGFAASLGLELTIGDKYYRRSDHYNFAKIGVPVVFFCDGEHEDYHKVTDHADKLDFVKMEKIARLAYWVGHHVATTRARPKELGRQESW